MSRIRGKDTKPELKLRSILHRAGFRFRLHAKQLPGKPDIVLPKFKTVIFVHGCYWHRHEGCPFAYTPKSNQDFWLPKLAETVKRDQVKTVALQKLGWTVLTVWECELKRQPSQVLINLREQLILASTARDRLLQAPDLRDEI